MNVCLHGCACGAAVACGRRQRDADEASRAALLALPLQLAAQEKKHKRCSGGSTTDSNAHA
eukprot:535825-Pleurochrysis_carterae.AAC.1